PPGRKAADVLLLVPLRELVLGEIAVLVPVLFLGDAEVDERTGPDIGESHAGRGWYRGGPTVPTGRARPGAPGPRLVRGRSSLAEERRADPHVGRSLLGGDPVVLARAHRELAQPVLLGELAEAAEVRPRSLGVCGGGRHRHQPPHVGIGPSSAGSS